MAVRLALLAHHYRDDWEWTDADLQRAADRLSTWREAVSRAGAAPARPVVEEVRAALAEDLDAPRALAAVDRWALATLEGADTSTPDGADVVRALVDARLGVLL
jgi:L-cysteine:1D-myo-inositol 2-amino-2-deoxy-alpha-D-glucopyranoside ligase